MERLQLVLAIPSILCPAVHNGRQEELNSCVVRAHDDDFLLFLYFLSGMFRASSTLASRVLAGQVEYFRIYQHISAAGVSYMSTDIVSDTRVKLRISLVAAV